MSRLVVVSNRLADPRKPAAGGLVVALGEVLNQTGGLWMGWSGNVLEGGAPGEGELHLRQAGAVTLATIDLCREDHHSYYHGYSNSVLWPVFHYRLDLADFNAHYIAGYRRVNQMFARKLLPLLRADDIIWIHDYHLIPLAAELRALGCRQRIGFFLHVPVPPPLIMAAIPQHEWLMRSLFAYDLVGLQSEADVVHFKHYVHTEGRAEKLGDQHVRAFGATVLVQAFPIGIDVDEFSRLTRASDAVETCARLRAEYSRRRLLLGIDRLDYSKGLPQRVRAFRELLERYPENCASATLVMIAAPTRDNVHAYTDLRQELEGLCGAVNGDYGELDWMPLRYIHRMVARKRVPGLCRAAAVGLVTPLRDGMNLVAKEYVVAQDPQDPGVLVLSRFAGAAEQLDEALLVNPYDTQAMADSMQRALQMPLVERQERHSKLMERIRTHDVHWWRRSFLSALQAAND
ncbi:alpha,alpha-trehalose-phosphate synthase (UDP-forming) [Verminephrobacter aporrectodeae]|uniref:Trehalose-6-phosphate synthase n=1 Tax=Verminephrobacter aporrectodeae subsp. tuberculatae TaxID=1110392 RepID=A0ABT3KY17_9BURK|nr:trehalose-6-phosphate synthase [Verminephrobacter aporrectodeae]MCW5223386.1 trehalose-6-phosphate synthase [Verminephrobacter aporrectodeae subsp. tuberculatae]MCW5256401.1 trehalose-6-phosphate synthase [Verminephrobacter aporrectodeae subsp. tuberculatae]MCW5288850.1 trehalose-6-phosphate synthase [Verminephrobacter aporrectodeae subsp. tuberculatae]MCW5323236.1 trehalose-6-phosphate synthase [Verminephrobacter aporrectodeae subsp. tuberculatae]MCW8163881.1 trehalose-6-phosphate synthase